MKSVTTSIIQLCIHKQNKDTVTTKHHIRTTANGGSHKTKQVLNINPILTLQGSHKTTATILHIRDNTTYAENYNCSAL